MPLLIKDGKLASIGGALKRFVAGCLDACCGKWYCHLPDYTCDQNDFDYVSEHPSRAACLQACGDGVDHFCHVGGECDTDPTDAVAVYRSKRECEAACGQWWCCYEALDYTKGSECREGPCDLPELIRAGPFDSKQDCEPDCEMQYYCVLAAGTDGTQPDHYMCVTDPAGMTILAGPQTEAECDATCYTRRPTIWCVDEKRCVLSFDGPPAECSFGVFCEEYDDFIACGQECLKEKWYCVPADNQCMQLALPPTPDAQPYGSQSECEKECQSYYCCWVSQGDLTKGSYCQLGKCDDGFEKSGPHEDEGICEADCNSIYCWSYYDTATSATVKECAEDPPLGDCEPNYGCEGSREVDGDQESENLMLSYRSDGFEADRTNIGGTLWRVEYKCQRETAECDTNTCIGPLLPDTCSHEFVEKVSGPYGRETDCERICNPPVYRWFCKDEVCTKCCASGTCTPTDIICPDGDTYETEDDCKLSCGSPCYFCENGTVTEDHLPADDCTGLGGFLNKPDAEEACKYICAIENPCVGYGEYLWTGTAWEIDDITCRPSSDCRPAPSPTQPGDSVGELKRVDCEPRVIAPDAAKYCITVEEFNKGGWVKVSGPHSTEDECREECGPPPDPCLFGLCIWRPPDPCSTGQCSPTLGDPSDPDACNGFPYDCTSESACNAWYAANPNPPCDCWFCEDGVWVNKKAYAKDCSEQGGYTGANPPEGVVCEPPPPVSCGVPVPRAATVNLCGFIDRVFKPPCVGGQTGYAAFFNQTVNLTLKDPVPAEPITWIGELSLPAGWPKHQLLLFRGTEQYETCDWAQMQITSSPACIRAIWLRNNNFGTPLSSFHDGWSFGTPTPTPTDLQTQNSYLVNIAVQSRRICQITFGGTAEAENPLP